MGKKLYVGNLPFTITDDELGNLFAQVGQVTSAKVITDRESGRSKGFGFVEMATDEEAQKAISQFDGGDVEGRALKVNEARPMENRSHGGGGRGFGGGGGEGRRGAPGGGSRGGRANRW